MISLILQQITPVNPRRLICFRNPGLGVGVGAGRGEGTLKIAAREKSRLSRKI